MARMVEVPHDEKAASFEYRCPYLLTDGCILDVTSPPYFGVTSNLFYYGYQSTDLIVRLSRKLKETIPLSIRFTILLKFKEGSGPILIGDDSFPYQSIKKKYSFEFSKRLSFCKSWSKRTDEYKIIFKMWRIESIYAESPKPIPAQKKLEAETKANDSVQRKNSPSSNSKDLSILSDNLKDLLNSGDDHDVVISVEDKQFKAHKCVLRVRSPIFAAMFRSDMKETASGTIAIDDCDPDAFGEFLQYVYTGRVDISSVKIALGLYYVGDKYDFPRLKEICVDFLEASLSTTIISDVITLAARHGEEELLQVAFNYLSENFDKVLMTVEWQRFHASNPTAANEMTLKAVQHLKASCTARKE